MQGKTRTFELKNKSRQESSSAVLFRTMNDKVIETMKESLQSPVDPDIGWIPATLPEKKRGYI